jgi:hypothetical protein
MISTVRRVEVYAIDGRPLPIDVMMSNMRYYHNAAVKTANMVARLKRDRGASRDDITALERIVTKNRAVSQDLAKDAAPFFHSRLDSIVVSNDGLGGANSLAAPPLVVQFYDHNEADPGVTDADYSVVEEDGVKLPEAAD